MNKLNDGLLLRDPLRIMDHGNTEGILTNSFGAIVARAGTGKTALIVQLAIDSIIKKRKILHVSLNEPLDKVNIWYKEVLNNLAKLNKTGCVETLWESVQSGRFIMTFNVEKFSFPTLKERFKDLTEQQIFQPDVVIVDGLPFENSIMEPLKNLKFFSQQQKLHLWFTVKSHRHEPDTPEGIPAELQQFDLMFDDIVQLNPRDKEVHIEPLKGYTKGKKTSQYFLDPATMLIKTFQ